MTWRRFEHVLSIDVIALPGPQGSKKFVGTTKAGRGIMVESSAKVKPWREAVVYAAREAIAGARYVRAKVVVGTGIVSYEPLAAADGTTYPVDGPIAVSMVFTLPKPASAPKRRTTHPDKKPDLSKLARSTEDALSDAGVWKDDARVVEYVRLAKVFPGEDPAALDVPGCRITIYRVMGA